MGSRLLYAATFRKTKPWRQTATPYRPCPHAASVFARVPCPIVLSQQFLLLLTVAFLLPLRLAFDFTSTTGLMVWDWFVDGALILDVIANFFVAYHDKKGALVESFPKIAKNYIKGW